MSEEEAKAMTCHKTLAPVVLPHNGFVDFHPASCIGSQCMAWRSEETEAFKARAEQVFKREGLRVVPSAHGDTRGWCGLVGKP